MTQTELALALSAALFAAFLLGWAAGWLMTRGSQPAASAEPVPDTETLGAARADADALRAELQESRIEIEELRAYIDRKLTRPPEG